MTSTHEAIVKLRAIREFDDRPIDPDDLRAVLEAARWTGSAKNRQNWAFIVVDDPQQKDRICAAGHFTVPIAHAPAAICLAEEPDTYEFDTGRAAQNIMLAADAIGLATCPVTLHTDEIAAEVLGLPPGWRCRYAIAIGYPAEDAKPSNKGGRRAIADVVHRNVFNA